MKSGTVGRAVRCATHGGKNIPITLLALRALHEPVETIKTSTFKIGDSIMDLKLLDILVCPLCKAPLLYRKTENELICKGDRLAFPIRDGIPVMLEDEARRLPVEEEIRADGKYSPRKL